MTSQNLTLTNRKSFSRIGSSAHQPIKYQGFQTYFTKYLNETLRHSIWDLKVCAYCFFKVTSSDHLHTYWTGGFKLNLWLSSILEIQNFNGIYEMHGLEVHVVVVHYKGSLWDWKLSLVTEFRFTTNRLFLIVNLQLIVKLLPWDWLV